MGLKYLNSSNGKPSASLTMAMVSFALTTGWLLFWLIGTTFGLRVPAFDATIAMGYMSPLLALYFGRRWTEAGSTEISDESEEESLEAPIINENTSDSEEVAETEEQEETAQLPAEKQRNVSSRKKKK